MHLASLDDARSWGCRRGCCHLFARPLTFECMDLEDLQQIAATVQVKTSWLAAWWYASCVAWWRQTMRLQARLLPSVCKTFDTWMYGSWGFATDCGNRAGEDELTSCLVVCILRRMMKPDHEFAGAVAAVCLQDLWHLNVWILRICNRLRQPCRWRLAD